MLMTVGYLLVALFTGKRAGDNPWDSRCWEWTTPSPPPKHNFTREPVFPLDPYDYTARAERMHG
jgi:cytochrome c oxidase subunit 1